MRRSWHELTGLFLLLVGCAAQEATGNGAPDGGGKGDGVGPTNAAIQFQSAAQKGGFWELGSGELFSAFQSGYESTPFGVRYKFSYTLVGPDATSASEGSRLGSAGECLDRDGNYECPGGLMTPSTQKKQSLVAHDDRILMAKTVQDHPRLMLVDPRGAASEVFADLTSIDASRVSRDRIDYRLERLPSGNIAFSVGLENIVPDRSVVLDDDGTVLGEIEGYIRGHRDDELLVLQKRSVTDHAYVWWNPATATTSPAFQVPSTYAGGPPTTHRTIVTHEGGVVLWPYGAPDRVFRYSPTGELELDDQLAQNNTIKGVSPTGDALVHKYVNTNGVWDWSLVLRDGNGDEQTIFSKAQLRTETSWNLSESTFSYPHFGGIKEPVIDDTGNYYVPMLKNAGGNSRTQTYLVGFTSTGERMFGVKLDEDSGLGCLPHSVLPSQRLAVLCPHRVTNELYLLGE